MLQCLVCVLRIVLKPEDPCLLFVTNSTTVLLVNLGARRGPEGPGCHLIYNRCRYSLQ
jgi:hypothetical protein